MKNATRKQYLSIARILVSLHREISPFYQALLSYELNDKHSERYIRKLLEHKACELVKRLLEKLNNTYRKLDQPTMTEPFRTSIFKLYDHLGYRYSEHTGWIPMPNDFVRKLFYIESVAHHGLIEEVMNKVIEAKIDDIYRGVSEAMANLSSETITTGEKAEKKERQRGNK